MNNKRLEGIRPIIEDEIEKGNLPGARVIAINKGERAYDEVFGYADIESKRPLTNDNMYRMFSLTKPITAVAAMQLIENGRINLTDNLSRFLPEYSEMTVLEEGRESHPASREITIHDLLAMTSGISYPDATPAGIKMTRIWSAQTKAYIDNREGKSDEKPLNTRDFVRMMASSPLAFDPGKAWMYGASADVMGAVIEVVSGMTLGEYFKNNILEPLGMTDTGFFIPEDKQSRLTTSYEFAGSKLVRFDKFHLALTDYLTQPSFESGGAGLVSTADDYARFAEMLLGGGKYGAKEILSRKGYEKLRSNLLTPKQIQTMGWDSVKGHGYGNFMRILMDPSQADLIGSIGEFGWDGWMGCYMCIDPVEDLAMLYFTQVAGIGFSETARRIKNMIWCSLK